MYREIQDSIEEGTVDQESKSLLDKVGTKLKREKGEKLRKNLREIWRERNKQVVSSGYLISYRSSKGRKISRYFTWCIKQFIRNVTYPSILYPIYHNSNYLAKINKDEFVTISHKRQKKNNSSIFANTIITRYEEETARVRKRNKIIKIMERQKKS